MTLLPPAVTVALFVFTAPMLETSQVARAGPSAVLLTKSPPLVLRV